ncbi:Crp/Fnr family transcriptional regulator [Marinigracilibium pacificum]|uniref:Crp/Fnr family transcriptional regulator n=1 Tax=Marinigracilibium pacificum TaxID=2729599 RepID=A0A848IZ95_9BACT|nr:Crp/Fnr family transcriptional regulator [Marinigracilibium pacificum]NMM49853.1 Crp/Fnr family transcriptional regulator [Marinigracilibium pacificum]
MVDEKLIRQYLPQFTDNDLIQEISNRSGYSELKAGDILIEPGQYIKMIPIILEGAIKVMRTDDEGHELFLYYLEPMETCAVSLTCCRSHRSSEIKAVAETDIKMINIPADLHEDLGNKFRQWKEYIAGTYQSRFEEVLKVIDDIAFKRMDERLLNYLLIKKNQLNTNEIATTHQSIANELGTSREVISRLLKTLEKKKLIELTRNKIFIRDNIEDLIG